ncbi:MAG: IclR family transcriptional regulator C-terminal domain-containing protein [Burkholderiaceae bacterium]
MLAPDERQALIRGLPLTTPTRRHRVSRRDLEQVIELEQARGWSVNLGEFRADVVSIAAGFRWHGSVHALVIAAPQGRVQARVNRLGQALHEMAASLAS